MREQIFFIPLNALKATFYCERWSPTEHICADLRILLVIKL